MPPTKTSNYHGGKHHQSQRKFYGRAGREALREKAKNMEDNINVFPLKPVAILRLKGGNVVAYIDKDNYNKGIQDLKFNVVGKLTLQIGDEVPTTMELRKKLLTLWKIDNLTVIVLEKGLFHVILYNLSEQTKILPVGTFYTKPSLFKVQRWLPGYNTRSSKLTTSLVWIRMLNLPLEFKKS